MAELSPEFIATAKRMGVPLPPRHRPRFFSSVRSYFRFRIDWTGPLTNDRGLIELWRWRSYDAMDEQQQDAVRKLSEALGVPIAHLPLFPLP